jgi:hemolysin III
VREPHRVSGGESRDTLDLIAPPEALTKPRYRGRVHRGACILAIPLGVVLVLAAHRAAAYVGAAIFATSIVALFGTSAAYHCGNWSERWRARWQRLDHTMIFVLIAGSYTPLALLALHHALGITLLALAWGVAIVGIAATLLFYDFVDRHEAVLYTVFGWILLPALPAVVRALNAPELICLAAGGVIYTIGAVGFAREYPDPRPLVFGYHEVWHVMTVAAAGCHFALVFQLVR